MFNFTDTKNINKEYNGFVLLSIDDLPEQNAKGIYLRHKRTGLEVYHIKNDDAENLFSFVFRTIAKDSKGTAHIMEHSTLCGSEKYPLKEPFTTLAGQTINSFLNAMTYQDKTAYPAASLIKNDYFNMMNVYADSVFFPKLDYTTFIQEGHRLELDKDGKLSIQGVVYNEMKGEYATFPQVAYSEQLASMFPDSYPAFDSGGDPLVIPDLTYEEFLNFHQRFYNPDNCLLFLYGNIPTIEQLDFLNEKYMSRIEKKYNCTKDVENYLSSLPIVNPKIKELQKLNLHKESKEIRTIAPETGSTGNLVTMNWYTGETNIEKLFLSELLCGSDSSPISIALKESKLGDELCCGNLGQTREEYFTLGLNGVKKENEKKVYDIITATLDKIRKNGVSQENIDAAIMGIDFSLREVHRSYGPPAIGFMSKVTKSWSSGKSCAQCLTPISNFEQLKEKIYADKYFIQKLVTKYFFDNEVVIKFVAEPSKQYFKNRVKTEEQLIKKLEKNLDKEKLKKDLQKLHAYQQKIETPEELSCIAHTKVSEISYKERPEEIELKFIKGINDSNVPLFVSEEDTKGIFYVDVLFPLDVIKPEDSKYISLLADVVTELGWNNKHWSKCIDQANCVMGDVWGRTVFNYVSDIPESQKQYQQYKHLNFMDRAWLSLSCKALTSQYDETLKMFAEIITTMSFNDEERFSSILQDIVAEKKSSIVSSGKYYAEKRSRANISANLAYSEILNGITQLYAIDEFSKTSAKEMLKKLESLYSSVRNAGAVIHITADKESLSKILPSMETFAQSSNISKLIPKIEYTLEDYLKYVVKSENFEKDYFTEIINEDSQTGYAVVTFPGSRSLSKEAIAEEVFSYWLDMHVLWDKIRTTGGAYGASAVTIPSEKIVSLSSYRDPTPEKSIETFIEVLQIASEYDYNDDEIERTIVSLYGDLIAPISPKERGRLIFDLFLSGKTNLLSLRKKMILQVTSTDVKEAAARLLKNTKEMRHNVIFCDKSKKCTGKILELPL